MRSPLPPNYIQDTYDAVTQKSGGYATARSTFAPPTASTAVGRNNVTVTYYNNGRGSDGGRGGGGGVGADPAGGYESGYGSTSSNTRTRKKSF